MGILKYTDIEEIPKIVNSLRQRFHTRQLDSIEYRIELLEQLYQILLKNSDVLASALEKDFHRASFETNIMELNPTLSELRYLMSNLKQWAKPQKGSSNPFIPYALTRKRIENMPLGEVLIISSFNYPLFLAISPLSAAIAGGNTVVLKLSELTENFSQVLTDIFEENKILSKVVRIVNGGPDEATVLLQQKFDKILFTGSKRVAKIVYAAAARHLTPVILELGGKCPAVVTDSLNEKQLAIAAKRIAWAKFGNAGQTCLAVDYALVHAKVYKTFMLLMKKAVKEEFFPDVSASDKNYTHIASTASYNRLVKLLNSTKGHFATGSATNDEKRYIDPTVVADVTWNDCLMEDELFGPILPLIKYENLADECDCIIDHHDTPLASYIFSNNSKDVEIYKRKVRSGAVFINDAMLHCANTALPFGGVGSSGHGSYHGKAGFDAFTHKRPVLSQAWWTEFLLNIRYPPYNSTKERLSTLTFLPFGKSEKAPRLLFQTGLYFAGIVLVVFLTKTFGAL